MRADAEGARAEAAEAQRDTLAEALEAIRLRAENGDGAVDWLTTIARIARDALAAVELPKALTEPDQDESGHAGSSDLLSGSVSAALAEVARPFMPRGNYEKFLAALAAVGLTGGGGEGDTATARKPIAGVAPAVSPTAALAAVEPPEEQP